MRNRQTVTESCAANRCVRAPWGRLTGTVLMFRSRTITNGSRIEVIPEDCPGSALSPGRGRILYRPARGALWASAPASVIVGSTRTLTSAAV